MKINVLMAFSGVLWGVALGAYAKPLPEPPPSGIVVHLFGPDSITSNILPEAASPGPNAPAGSAAGPNGQAETAGPGGTAQPGQPAATAYQEPSMHDVLHQMFVTGDPNMTPREKLAKGRTADYP